MCLDAEDDFKLYRTGFSQLTTSLLNLIHIQEKSSPIIIELYIKFKMNIFVQIDVLISQRYSNLKIIISPFFYLKFQFCEQIFDTGPLYLNNNEHSSDNSGLLLKNDEILLLLGKLLLKGSCFGRLAKSGNLVL